MRDDSEDMTGGGDQEKGAIFRKLVWLMLWELRQKRDNNKQEQDCEILEALAKSSPSLQQILGLSRQYTRNTRLGSGSAYSRPWLNWNPVVQTQL